MHDSGHACVVNTAVLDLLPADVPHDDGLLVEQAMGAVRRLRLPHAQCDLADAIEHAARACLAEGVTACAEAGIGGGLLGHSPVELGAYQLLRDQGRLPLRIQLMPGGDTLKPSGAHEQDGIPRALDLGLRTGFGDDWLSVGPLKIYTDGGMMARTAALTEPYEGLDHTGRLQDDAERLRDLIVDGHLGGWQLAVHAIGDRAADLALDALEHAQRAAAPPRRPPPHRARRTDPPRPAPPHGPARRQRGRPAQLPPLLRRRLRHGHGERRAPWMCGQGFLSHGITVVGSSDRPVADGSPLRAISSWSSARPRRAG